MNKKWKYYTNPEVSYTILALLSSGKNITKGIGTLRQPVLFKSPID